MIWFVFVVCASSVYDVVLVPFGTLTIEVSPNDKIRYLCDLV